jgi:SPP1 gp7 family putative phage head morphogenesis protein
MARLNKAIRKAFKATAQAWARDIGEALNKADQDEIRRVLDSLNLSGLTVIHADADVALKAIAKSGVAAALAQIGIEDEGITELANTRALAWAEARAAELVGMKVVGGTLVQNPDAGWRIDTSTRELLRGFVAEAIDQGWSNDRLAREIEDTFAFSEQRAQIIARTETAYADVAGNMIAYEDSGMVTQKRWILAQERYCDVCESNAAQGPIALRASFVSGEYAPPAHPNCRCDVIPILGDDS